MKFTFIVKTLLPIYLLFTTSCKDPEKLLLSEEKASSPTTGVYNWKTLKVGAGGWVVGLDVHPTEANLVYARTDVSGAYRYVAATNTWKQLVTSSSLPSAYTAYATYEGVHSLVGAPNDPNIAYMAYRGQVFRSTNKGDTWSATTFGSHGVTMEPNGQGRQEGERLAVDPNNNNVVYYGSIAHRLWVTTNGGSTWTQISSIPAGMAAHGVNTIVFDTASGTTGSKTNGIYVTIDDGGVYKSSDAGTTWSRISDTGPGTNMRYRDAEIGPDGTYYVACNNANGYSGAVWKYSSAGTWTNITPAASLSYEDLAIDPNNGNHVIVMRQGGQAWGSTDQGSTWTVKSFYRWSPTILWLGLQTDYWLSVGELEFDPLDAGKLWFAEGFSVWHTKDLADGNISWNECGKGIEETCGNAVICPPGGKPVTAMWDIGAFYHSNPDQYNAKRMRNSFISGWGLDWCPADPAFIVGTFQDHTNSHANPRGSGYSTDGGQNWTVFPSVASGTAHADLTYGNIAVSADNKDTIVWLPSNHKLPYYTANRGVTWTQASFTGITTSGVNQSYTARKPLCADRVQASTFYFYHHLNGVYRSTNDGANWTLAGSGPVSNRWNAMMKAAPGNAQHLWFAEGKQANVVGGLWHSTDGGATWLAISGVEQAFSFGFGKAVDSTSYPAIFVTGVVAGQHGIYRSDDAGANWQQIGTFPLGIYDYVDDIDGDKNVFGKVYICFASSGFAYGELVP
jgi:hypothetical protein